MKPRHTAEQSTVRVNKAEDRPTPAARRHRLGGRSPVRQRPRQAGTAPAAASASATWPPHAGRARDPRRRASRGGDRSSTSCPVDPHGRPAVRQPASDTAVADRVTASTRADRATSLTDHRETGRTWRILGTGIQEGLLLKPVTYQWAMDLYDQAVANTWFPQRDPARRGHRGLQADDRRGDARRHVPDELLQPERAARQQGARVRRLPLRQRGRGAPLPRQADVGGGQPLHGVRVRARDVPDRPRGGVRRRTSTCRRWRAKEEFEVTLHPADDRADPRHHDDRGQAGLRPQPRRVQHHPRGHLVLLGLHGGAVVPAAEPAAQLRLAHRLGRARREPAPEVRHQPHPHRARGEPRPADRRSSPPRSGR